jgi:hypothetical protein
VPTDPFVPVTRDEAPRHRQNLPPGVAMPPARSWYAKRPGDGEPATELGGELHGRPGPNIGYAMTLVARQRSSWVLDSSETPEDAGAVVAEIAMKRAARFGRAPVKHDVDLAVSILGYDGTADPGWVARRVMLVLGAAHHYDVRRALVDLVPDELLAKAPAEVAAVSSWRSSAVAPAH